MKTINLSPKVLALIVLGVLAVVALVGWFGLVSSQKSTSSKLDSQIAQEQANLATIGTPPPKQTSAPKTKAVPKSTLAAALPADLNMPQVLLQVQRVANESKVTLDSFTPSAAMPLAGYEAIPIDLIVTGPYRSIQRFVRKLRTQAVSIKGRPHASGRLFAVETLGLTPGGTGLPELSATIRIDTFRFSGVVPAPTPTEAPATDESTSTSTDSGTAAAAPVGEGS